MKFLQWFRFIFLAGFLLPAFVMAEPLVAVYSTTSDNSTNVSGSSSPLTLTQDDLSTLGSTTATTAGQVTSVNDLTAFEATSLRADPNVRSISLSQSSVQVSYDEQGQLFGFLPVVMPVTANVDPAGNVTVNYPWYGFLVSANKNALETALNAGVQTNISTQGLTVLTPSQEAAIAANIITAMKNRYDADSSQNATSTSASSSESVGTSSTGL